MNDACTEGIVRQGACPVIVNLIKSGKRNSEQITFHSDFQIPIPSWDIQGCWVDALALALILIVHLYTGKSTYMMRIAACRAIMYLCRCQAARFEVAEAGGVPTLLRLIRPLQTPRRPDAASEVPAGEPPEGSEPTALAKAAASALFGLLSSRAALSQLVGIGGVDVLSGAAISSPPSKCRDVLVKVLRKVATHSDEARKQLAAKAGKGERGECK